MVERHYGWIGGAAVDRDSIRTLSVTVAILLLCVCLLMFV